MKSEQQPVPEGPVRDALAAVDLGAKADPTTADWPKLRAELEALLEKPEEKKDDQQKQEDQQKDQKSQDQKNEDQQKQDSKSSPENQKQPDGSPKQEQSQDSSKEKNEPPKEPESAFGDMKEKTSPPSPPPPPQGDTQKVGGAPEKRPPDPAAEDPSLAQPLQKLDQLRNEDSPARLFQLMDGDRKPEPNKKGKDW